MFFNEFKDVNLNCIKLGMTWCVEMFTKGLTSIRFGNITEMFRKAFFQFSLGLTHIQFITVCAFQAVDEIATVASVMTATF